MKFFLQAIAVVAAYSVTIARAAPVMPTITAWGVTSSANGVQQAPSVSQSIADLPASSLQYIADDGVQQAPSVSKSIADLPASSLQYIVNDDNQQAQSGSSVADDHDGRQPAPIWEHEDVDSATQGTNVASPFHDLSGVANPFHSLPGIITSTDNERECKLEPTPNTLTGLCSATRYVRMSCAPM